MLCAVAAAITGLFIASRLGAGSPTIAIEGGYDLESIAAVVLGGTYLLGGRGGVLGTLAGVFILAMLDSTFNQLEVNAFAKDVARGVIIIAAVAAYSVRWTRRRREEAQAATGQTPGPEPAVGGATHVSAAPAPRSRSRPPASTSARSGSPPALAALRAIPVVWLLLIVVFAWIAWEDENFLTPEGFLAYLKTSAPARDPRHRGLLRARVRRVRPLGRIAGDGDRRRRGEADRRRSREHGSRRSSSCSGSASPVGLFNGFATTILRVPSFIVTLAMLLILNGAVFLWTGGAPVGDLADNFRAIGREGIEGFPVLEELPYSAIVLIACARPRRDRSPGAASGAGCSRWATTTGRPRSRA